MRKKSDINEFKLATYRSRVQGSRAPNWVFFLSIVMPCHCPWISTSYHHDISTLCRYFLARALKIATTAWRIPPCAANCGAMQVRVSRRSLGNLFATPGCWNAVWAWSWSLKCDRGDNLWDCIRFVGSHIMISYCCRSSIDPQSISTGDVTSDGLEATRYGLVEQGTMCGRIYSVNLCFLFCKYRYTVHVYSQQSTLLICNFLRALKKLRKGIAYCKVSFWFVLFAFK